MSRTNLAVVVPDFLPACLPVLPFVVIHIHPEGLNFNQSHTDSHTRTQTTQPTPVLVSSTLNSKLATICPDLVSLFHLTLLLLRVPPYYLRSCAVRTSEDVGSHRDTVDVSRRGVPDSSNSTLQQKTRSCLSVRRFEFDFRYRQVGFVYRHH